MWQLKSTKNICKVVMWCDNLKAQKIYVKLWCDTWRRGGWYHTTPHKISCQTQDEGADCDMWQSCQTQDDDADCDMWQSCQTQDDDADCDMWQSCQTHDEGRLLLLLCISQTLCRFVYVWMWCKVLIWTGVDWTLTWYNMYSNRILAAALYRWYWRREKIWIILGSI